MNQDTYQKGARMDLTMEQDLKNKIEALDPAELDLASRSELGFSFKHGHIKKTIIYTVDGSQYLLLFYFGVDKPLITYATSEPRRPYVFKRMPTVLNILSHVTTGTFEAMFYVKTLSTTKENI